MRHRSDPVNLIRNNNPVPDAHQLPDEPTASFEALFEEIIGMEHQEPTQTSDRSRPRIGRVSLLAAAFVVLSAGAAFAAGVFTLDPEDLSQDPEDVATIEEDGAQYADVHLEGWRPGLKTEAVWCLLENGTGANTLASGFPLSQPLTTEELIAECGTDNDAARRAASPPTEFTVCEATLTDQMYQDRLGRDAAFDIIAGDLADDRPGFPVVLGWDADCASTQLDTSLDVDLQPLSSLDEINQAREVEISLRAAALQSCFSLEEARSLARGARAELGESWLLLDLGQVLPARCYTVNFDLQWGTISAFGRDDGTPAEPNDATEPQD